MSRMAPMSSAERAPHILCAGIIVLDEVFRVDEFPQPDSKVQAKGFFVVNGGCAANAAVAIARLGGRAALAGPMGGPAGGGGKWGPALQRMGGANAPGTRRPGLLRDATRLSRPLL